jgi:hypothetical protein
MISFRVLSTDAAALVFVFAKWRRNCGSCSHPQLRRSFVSPERFVRIVSHQTGQLGPLAGSPFSGHLAQWKAAV